MSEPTDRLRRLLELACQQRDENGARYVRYERLIATMAASRRTWRQMFRKKRDENRALRELVCDWLTTVSSDFSTGNDIDRLKERTREFFPKDSCLDDDTGTKETG